MTKGNIATLCPSAPAGQGAQLIGVVDANGRVANLGAPLTINQDFVEKSQASGPVERRFRFASPCAERRCGYWTGQECGLIGKLDGAINKKDTGQPLSRCAIRANCRWWQQRGRDACAICSFVVTGGEGAPGGYIAP